MIALIDGRKTMTVCDRKAQKDHDRYVKTVSLKVKISMEGDHHQVIGGRHWHDKPLTNIV